MITFSEAVRLHRQHLRAKRRSVKTLDWYDEQFAAFDRWRLAAGLADALPDAETIDAYIADQHDRHRPATVHARFRALRALLNFLERRRKIERDDNPIHLVDAPSMPQEVRRHVSVVECEALLASIGSATWLDHRDRLIVLLLMFSGLRVGELCGLAVEDINSQRCEVTVRRAKGDKSRVVPCVEDVRPALAAYLYSRPSHAEALLLASDGYGGTTGALTAEGVRQMLIRRCRAAGIAIYNPHAFRHGFAMWLLNAGARMTTVSAAMGHSDPAITSKVYAHTTTATVRREYEEAVARARRRP
jgi:integrase/recombinase XerD